jgi:putative YphP/YqiW family bacilliredoxin
MYPAEIVIPMKEELTESGFKEIVTPEEWNSQLEHE